MLTHEMVHLAFPSVDDKHHWIEEGIATYVEPIARIHVGHLKPGQMWFDLVRDMPQGFPQHGDRGLDHTHTWGRTYWGGALFCLLADVEIRRQTNNVKGLEQALRGIIEAGGDIRKDCNLETALRAGDRAVGVSVLHPLYIRMKDMPVSIDLDSLGRSWEFSRREAVSVSRMAPNWRRSGERSLHRNPTRLRTSLRLPELPRYLLGGPRVHMMRLAKCSTRRGTIHR